MGVLLLVVGCIMANEHAPIEQYNGIPTSSRGRQGNAEGRFGKRNILSANADEVDETTSALAPCATSSISTGAPDTPHKEGRLTRPRYAPAQNWEWR